MMDISSITLWILLGLLGLYTAFSGYIIITHENAKARRKKKAHLAKLQHKVS